MLGAWLVVAIEKLVVSVRGMVGSNNIVVVGVRGTIGSSNLLVLGVWLVVAIE